MYVAVSAVGDKCACHIHYHNTVFLQACVDDCMVPLTIIIMISIPVHF